MQESIITTAEAETVEFCLDPIPVKQTATATTQMTIDKSNTLRMLSNAVASGKATPEQIRQIRNQINIPQSFFTGKKVDRAKVKRKKKLAAASRKRNKDTGKGQKRSGGNGVYTRT